VVMYPLFRESTAKPDRPLLLFSPGPRATCRIVGDFDRAATALDGEAKPGQLGA
jgi:hypothetical protein